MKMETMGFFDEMVNRGMLFLSVHDAILYIKMETASDITDPMMDKVLINDRFSLGMKKMLQVRNILVGYKLWPKMTTWAKQQTISTKQPKV